MPNMIRSSDPCRNDPTWSHPTDSRQECAERSQWTPRSVHWEGQLDRFEGMVLEGCVELERNRHLQEQHPQVEFIASHNAPQTSQSKLRGKAAFPAKEAYDHDRDEREMRVVRMYPESKDKDGSGLTAPQVQAVEIRNAWSESEAAALIGTATCVRRYHGDTHFADRHFAGGGNNCTFMAGYLQMLAPGVSAHVVNLVRLARKAAGWDRWAEPPLSFPDPGALGVRTNEHLQYAAGGHVGLHTDDESVYTIVVALSEPDAYQGGEYVLYEDDDDETQQTLVRLPRLSALVFLSSLTSHGVAPVTGGLREMFAAEFWEEDDVPHYALRPNLQEYREEVLGEVMDEAQGDL